MAGQCLRPWNLSNKSQDEEVPMRKTITVLLALGLILGAFMAPAADAKKKKKKPYKRVATHEYQVPALGAGDVGGSCPNATNSCAHFPTTAKDKYIQVTIEDQSGMAVYGTVSHPDQNGDGFVESLGSFCGESGKVAIQSGAEVIIFPYLIGSFLEGCQGVAAGGTITGTFTSK
jgi:hypothetical protein